MKIAPEWRESWTVVLVALLGVGLVSMPMYSFGAFIASLSGEFGWTKAQISTAISIQVIGSGVGAPLAGRLADRWGARRLALAGTLLLCGSFAALSQVQASILPYWFLWGLIAVGSILCSPVVWSVAVGTRFLNNRGLALAIVWCGSNLGGAVLAPFAAHLIQSYGWRNAYWGLALCMFAAVFPLALAFLYDARDLDRRRGSLAVAAPSETPPSTGLQQGLTLPETLRTRTFWTIVVSLLLGGGAVASVIVHLVPLLQERGMSPVMAASAVGTMAATAAGGRIVAGLFLDRVFAPRVTAVAFAFPVVACLALTLIPVTPMTGFAAAVMFGVALGAGATQISYLSLRYFGLKSFGLVCGMLLAAYSVGSGLMPPAIGWVYQLSGNYQSVPLVLAACYLVSAALLQFSGPYPDWRAKGIDGEVAQIIAAAE